MRVGSCFSGIGGLDLGLEAAGGFGTAWFIENDPHCQKVLRRHWPDVPVFGDIHEVEADDLPPVDMIAGGYPCQPFSVAGKRRGESDDRHLWPQMRRLVRLLRPQLVLIENVPGHLVLGFGSVLCDLAEDGYDAEWGVVSAQEMGAPHLRKRLFVVAYSDSELLHRTGGRRQGGRTEPPVSRPLAYSESDRRDEGRAEPTRAKGRPNATECRAADELAHSDGAGLEGHGGKHQLRGDGRKEQVGGGCSSQSRTDADKRQVEPPLGRDLDGLPGRLGEARWPAPPGHEQHGWEPPRTCEGEPGRVAELKGLGNAVVPQVAEYIGRLILEATNRA